MNLRKIEVRPAWKWMPLISGCPEALGGAHAVHMVYVSSTLFLAGLLAMV